jgi:hypothetical protein
MKDQRVAFLRTSLEGLVESLDATARISRWSGAEPVPEPLEKSASQLLDRLGTANRLAADRYSGAPVVVTALKAMSAAIQRLDVAFVEFRRSIEGSPAQKNEAALALEAEIDAVRNDATKWS